MEITAQIFPCSLRCISQLYSVLYHPVASLFLALAKFSEMPESHLRKARYY